MSKTFTGDDNPDLEMESSELNACARIYYDIVQWEKKAVTARKRNVFEMQKVEKNKQTSMETAANSSKQSDTMMSVRLSCFMVAVLVVSVLITSAALVFVFALMLHSDPTTNTCYSTLQGKILN